MHHYNSFACLGNDITAGSSVSVFCAGTSLKRMEWEGEMVGSIVLLFYNQVVFYKVHSKCQP